MIILFGRSWILESVIVNFRGGAGAGVVDCFMVICAVSFDGSILIFV